MQWEETLWHGRRCWTLANDQIKTVITQWGAQFAEISLIQLPAVSPLWIPPWETRDDDSYKAELHAAALGNTRESRLLSGIVGHNLCFPYWGAPSDSEYRAGMTFHGEANLNRWTLKQETPDAVTLTGLFPESRLSMERRIKFSGNTIECKSRAFNLSAWDRPVAWCEHVTFGPPFLAPGITRFAASAGQGFRNRHEHDASLVWPKGKGGIECDLTTFSAEVHSDLVNSFLFKRDTEDASFMAGNQQQGIEIEYRFPRKDYPWLNVWENHDARMLTRGMEFSNTPMDGSMKSLVKVSEILGTPSYDWIDGKSDIEKSFTIEIRRISSST